MTDIATITAFLGSIKTATEIAKAISSADATLERAELKFKIAELLESIANAKIQAIEIQETLQEKDQVIQDLRDRLNGDGKLIRKNGRYYESDQSGQPTGDPYCSHCWEAKDAKIHLSDMGGIDRCPSCHNVIID